MGMKRLIIHWTGGTNRASDVDKNHYHKLVQGDGTIVDGVYPISANERLRGGAYAQHTRGCNEGSIGVSMCGMYGAIEEPFKAGKYPINKKQWDKTILLVADLARKYKIPVTPQTILSHAEVQGTLGIAQRQKWDIARLPFDPSKKGAKAVGDYFRAGVKLAMIDPSPKPSAAPPKLVQANPKIVAATMAEPIFTPPAAPAPSLWARFKALFSKGAT